MGCWEETDGFTRLPILEGDQATMVIARKFDHWNYHLDNFSIAHTPLVAVRGTYDGYGSIEEKDRVPECLGDLTSSSFQNFFEKTFLAEPTVSAVDESFHNSEHGKKVCKDESSQFLKFQNRLSSAKSEEERSGLTYIYEISSDPHVFGNVCKKEFGLDPAHSQDIFRHLVRPMAWICFATRTYLFGTEGFSGFQRRDVAPYMLKHKIFSEGLSVLSYKNHEIGLEEDPL